MLGNRRNRGSALLSRAQLNDPLTPDRLAGLINEAEPDERASEAAEADERASEAAEAETDQPEMADSKAADVNVQSTLAVTVPADTKDVEPNTAEVGDARAAGAASAAALLALAQKLHDELLIEGQETRARLITEGQLSHDQVIGEANAKQEELLAAAQSKHDHLVSVGETKQNEIIAEVEALLAKTKAENELLITETRERATEMVAEAQEKRAGALQGLTRESSLLQNEIGELRSFEREHRARLKSYFRAQLIDLGENDADETDGVSETG